MLPHAFMLPDAEESVLTSLSAKYYSRQSAALPELISEIISEAGLAVVGGRLQPQPQPEKGHNHDL